MPCRRGKGQVLGEYDRIGSRTVIYWTCYQPHQALEVVWYILQERCWVYYHWRWWKSPAYEALEKQLNKELIPQLVVNSFAFLTWSSLPVWWRREGSQLRVLEVGWSSMKMDTWLPWILLMGKLSRCKVWLWDNCIRYPSGSHIWHYCCS